MEMLKNLAKDEGVFVGGSYLAQDGHEVFNTFVLACPNGAVFTHDKDLPSLAFQSSFFAGGEDSEYVRLLTSNGGKTLPELIPPREANNRDGLFSVDGLNVGVAMCWELVRNRTPRRLQGKVDLLLGASGWWWSDPELGWPGASQQELAQDRMRQAKLIQKLPRRLARASGVPVVNANFVGIVDGYLNTDYREPVKGRYMGESQIVDRCGKTVARLPDGEGVIVADVIIDPKNRRTR